jgi:hypothetical protein
MDFVRSGQKFDWDAVAGATSYDFEVLGASGVGNPLASNHGLSATEILVEVACAGLSLSTTYNARVRANDGFGPGLWSANLTFQISPLNAPANFHVQ